LNTHVSRKINILVYFYKTSSLKILFKRTLINYFVVVSVVNVILTEKNQK